MTRAPIDPPEGGIVLDTPRPTAGARRFVLVAAAVVLLVVALAWAPASPATSSPARARARPVQLRARLTGSHGRLAGPRRGATGGIPATIALPGRP